MLTELIQLIMKDRQWRPREYATYSGLLYRADPISSRSIAEVLHSEPAQKNQRTYSYCVIDRALGRDLRELSRRSPD